jgi:hypothetical protein
MIPEEVRPPESVPSLESEGTQLKDSPQEPSQKEQGQTCDSGFRSCLMLSAEK